MEYSKNHKQIVEDLMAGKFILPTNKNFLELKEKEKFYEESLPMDFRGSLFPLYTVYDFRPSLCCNQ